MSLNQEYLIYYALQSPLILGTVFAAALCLIRHRENPRGAALLGLAILANLIACVPTLLMRHFPDISQQLFAFARDSTSGYVTMMLTTTALSGISWCLIGLAVFPRTTDSETVAGDAS
jgi:hypothetical protein